MANRSAHLVGSLPGTTAAEAMSTALDVLGPYLRSLPDGETGVRRNWILSVFDGLRDHPDLELAKEGDWSDYNRLPRLRVRRGHRLFGATLELGHLTAVQDSYPAFRKAIAAAGREDIVFQSGVPSDFDMAMTALGPVGGLRHRRAFTEATLTEIRDVAAMTGPSVLFQIEVPFELVGVIRAPGPARAIAARRLARNVTTLAAGSAPGTQFAVHLCLGDMNNHALGRLTDAAPLVLLTNEIVRQWPDDRELELVHAPFAAGDRPAPDDRAFYQPLAQLRLPDSVRFAAGIAHESQPLDAQRRIRGYVDEQLGREVDIAAACGLGRRDFDAARAVLDRTADLCSA